MRFFLQLVALQKKIHQKIYFFLSKFCEANLPLAPDAIDFTGSEPVFIVSNGPGTLNPFLFTSSIYHILDMQLE
jgi:hypothetical protein